MKSECKDCKWWDGYYMPKPGEAGYSEHEIQNGQCRRHSPPYIRAFEFMDTNQSCPNSDELFREGVWPVTMAYDWCGEFEKGS